MDLRSVSWLESEMEAEREATEIGFRLVRIEMGDGQYGIGMASLLLRVGHSSIDHGRQWLYRLKFRWLAKSAGADHMLFAEKLGSIAGTSNSLQFRVIEDLDQNGRPICAAKLGPKGSVIAEPQGVGLMSYLRALLVSWVAEQHGSAEVLAGSLSSVDASTSEALERRNAFYKSSGFEVVCDAQGNGSFSASQIDLLSKQWSRQKVSEIAPELIAQAFIRSRKLDDTLATVDRLHSELSSERARRFLSQRMLRRSWGLAVAGAAFILLLVCTGRLRIGF